MLQTVRAAGAMVAEVARFGADVTLPSGSMPRTAHRVSPQWMAAALGLDAAEVLDVSVLDEHHGTASRARLAVRYRDPVSGPATVFLKFAPNTLIGRLFMNMLGLGEREIAVYRKVIPALEGVAPHPFAAVWDGLRGRGLLLIEDLQARGCRLADITAGCTPDDASAVLATLAGVHGRFWDSPRFASDLADMRSGPTASGAVTDQLRSTALRRNVTGVPEQVQKESLLLSDDDHRIASFWQQHSHTFTHGDTHLGNTFFNPDGSAGYFDWQVSSHGPAIRDVAYFVTSSMRPDEARAHERDLLEEYRGRLVAAGGPDFDTAELWTLYRASVTHYYVGAVVTMAFGGRLQHEDIAREGVERAVAAVTSLESFEALRRLVTN